MSILESIFATETTKVSDLLNPALWVYDGFGGQRTSSGQEVSPQTATALSAYTGCLRVLSEDVAKLPWKLFKHTGPRSREEAPDHPVSWLIRKAPNQEVTSQSFRETLTFWAAGWGNGYAEIERNTRGVPVALHPIHPSRVRIKRDADTQELFYEANYGDGQWMQIPASRMFHLKGLGDDPVQGFSVCKIGAESMGISLAAQKFGASFFGNGAVVSGILTTPEELDDKTYARIRKQWKKRYQGMENVGNTAILEEGMKYERVGIPPGEAQFLETRGFQVVEICRWFRMQPHKVQDLQRATYNNVEAANIDHVGDTLMPWLVRWEGEADRKLLFPDEQGTFYTKIVEKGLLRGDSQSRGAYYQKRFTMGTLSQNDIRELEDENDIGPEGDVYYVPLNMVRSKDAASGNTPKNPKLKNPTGDQKDAGTRGAVLPDASRVLGALEPVFLDAAERVLKREANAIQRQAGKEDRAPLEAFFAAEAHFIAEAFTPAVCALVHAIERRDHDVVRSEVRAFAAAHVEELRNMVGRSVSFPAIGDCAQIMTQSLMERIYHGRGVAEV